MRGPGRRSAGRGSRRSRSRRPISGAQGPTNTDPAFRIRATVGFEWLDVDRQVLRRVGVDEGDGRVERRREHDPPVRAGPPQDRPAGRRREATATAASTVVGEGAVGRDEQGRRVGAVLGLGQEIGCHVVRVGRRSARTMPSDGPAGRSIPTSPKTSSLAAVTQALPGPTIRSTGREAALAAVRRRAPRSPGRRRRR